jgi:hypothetical protein
MLSAMKNRAFSLGFALLLSFGGSVLAAEPPRPLSKLAGEDLEFRVRWGAIPAGKASLEVIDEGGGRLTFRAKARSLPVLRNIYPVEELIESTVTLPGPRAQRYYKRAKEGWGPAQKDEVLFDYDVGTARLTRNEKPKATVPIPALVHDPLSVFYAYRTAAGIEDGPVTLAITDGAKVVDGVITVLGRETLETPAGVFRTILVEPKIEGIGGIFKKSPGARILIWLTDDEWRRPVKLQSKVVVGHFTAELVKIGP